MRKIASSDPRGEGGGRGNLPRAEHEEVAVSAVFGSVRFGLGLWGLAPVGISLQGGYVDERARRRPVHPPDPGPGYGDEARSRSCLKSAGGS